MKYVGGKNVECWKIKIHMDKHGWLLTLSLWNLAATATPAKPVSQSCLHSGNELLNKALSYNPFFP